VSPVEKRVALRTGVTIAYVDDGPRDRSAVVGLPGWPDPWQSFAPVLACLPTDARGLSLSWRGCGNSDRPENGYEPAALARDLVAFLDEVGIDTAIFVGHSLGSLVAQRVAIDHPRRVIGLALIGAFATLRGTDAAPGLEQIARELPDPMPVEQAREIAASVTALPVPDELLDTLAVETAKAPTRVWRAGLTGVLGADYTDEIGSIRAPTLLLWGDRDALVARAAQEQLVTLIPDARLVVYEGAGHSPNWEVPARVAADALTLRT
jgi:pimeloyl-ACP methyl ester carboxylesterase